MNIAFLYISISLVYIFFICLDGEDIKPKWKQWLANRLDIKPEVEIKYIKPEDIRITSSVVLSHFDLILSLHDTNHTVQLKKRAIESLYDNILKVMIENNLIFISQHKSITTDSIIYVGECYVNKPRVK